MQLQSLPLHEWESTKMTLHLFCQIIGKVRLKQMPRKNHWWNITLYPNTKGITTDTMPYKSGCFEIQLNFLNHTLEVNTSNNGSKSFDLVDGLSVATFYEKLFECLSSLDIDVKIINHPYSLPDANPITTPFSDIENYASYQKEYVVRFWKIMLWVQNVFEKFGGRYYGKTSPVQLFWHHLDLTVTRFSGKKIPLSPTMKLSDKDAYSHEVVSFGFWAGDDNVPAPAFYSYTYPAPDGLSSEVLQPSPAHWIDSNGSPMAILKYDDLLEEKEDPESVLLSFLESAYQAGAKLAKWPIQEMAVPDLKDL